ncbi:MAG: hypothetical protein VYA15_07300 [SAR324 cluster bacterium]|nr:hypothetical protein [SAR324 cluster bacterium]
MAQVSLYGYLKARAGTQYVSLIKDPLFASSMKTARNQIFFACLMDLSLYVLKTIHARKQQNFQNLDTFARRFFIQTLAKAPEEVFESLEREEVILEFEKHLSRHNWSGTDDSHESFSGSRSALLEWAPVVEEFKIQDEEIVSNSIHFKWLRVCQEFEKLTDFEKIRLEADADLPDLEKEVPEGPNWGL